MASLDEAKYSPHFTTVIFVEKSALFPVVIRKLNKFSLTKIKLCCFSILLFSVNITQYAVGKMGEERGHGFLMRYVFIFQ